MRYSLLLLLLLVVMLGCTQKGPNGQPVRGGPTLSIVSGSENELLVPIIERFAAKQNANVNLSFKGSLDIMQMLAEGKGITYDAVWPANSLWISLGDTQKVVSRSKSIMRSPVVFGVKKSIAQGLGWVNKPITVADILTAVSAKKLRFAMTSATQSNSGASAYLGFLHALAGSPDVLTQANLDDPKVQNSVKALLHGINRSSGSSGWLKDMFLTKYDDLDAMVNYEAIIIETNTELRRRGKEELYACYPADGLMTADSPLGLVDKGNAVITKLFEDLQAYLLSEEVQQELQGLGRRTGVVGMEVKTADVGTWNPALGFDVKRVISSVPTPAATVIQHALDLYQTALRKPSMTVYVLDYSGSMSGNGGETQLKQAMEVLLDVEKARRYLLQSSVDDVHVVIPFNDHVIATWQRKGNDPGQLRSLLGEIQGLSAGGGTNIYEGAAQALSWLNAQTNRGDYFPAVILMTDGQSSGSIDIINNIRTAMPDISNVPIFTIMFGAADKHQVSALAELTAARVFDGSKDLVGAFRNAKGYN